MNEAVVVIGSAVTVLILLGTIIAIIDGIWEALAVIGFTVAVAIGCTLIVLFWVWAAGGFA